DSLPGRPPYPQRTRAPRAPGTGAQEGANPTKDHREQPPLRTLKGGVTSSGAGVLPPWTHARAGISNQAWSGAQGRPPLLLGTVKLALMGSNGEANRTYVSEESESESESDESIICPGC